MSSSKEVLPYSDISLLNRSGVSSTSALKMLEKVISLATIQNETVRQGLLEVLATFVLMTFAMGSVAQVVVGQRQHGEQMSSLGFGSGIMLGVHAAGGITASLTFANCLIGRLPWYKFPVYMIGQSVSCFLASSAVFALYYDALQSFTEGNLTVMEPAAATGIFSIYPAPYMSVWGGYFNEFIATSLLLIGVLAIHDAKSAAALQGTGAFIMGLLVVVIGMSMGTNIGDTTDSSRDLPPRIFTAIVRWRRDVFRAGNFWWWVVRIAAPTLGILICNILIDFYKRSQPQSRQKHKRKKDRLDTEIQP
uniref:Aquaporin 7 n=1 Tax=Anolis carolinensis TaxID=28377 RepID=H9GF75_ANOCA